MCRSALVLALLLLPAAVVRADEAEDKALALVKELKGTVERDEKKAGKPVVRVSLGFTQISDAGLKELAALQQLQELYLDFTQISDAGLKELAGLKRQAAASLTEREWQILNGIASGESNRRIAIRLVISEHTVRAHVRNLMKKLGVGTRAQAAAVAAGYLGDEVGARNGGTIP